MRKLAARLLENGDARRFGLGLVWSTVGMAAVRLTPLVTTVIISHTLGIESVGQFAVIYGTLMSAGMLAATGVSVMAMRNIAAEADRSPDFAGRIAGLAIMLAVACGLLLTMLFYTLAEPIAGQVLAHPEIAPYLALVAPIITLNATSQVMQSLLNGLQRFDLTARLNVVYGIALILGVPAGLVFYGLEGCFIAMGLATLSLCLVTLPVLLKALARKGIQLQFRGALSEWPLITRYAIPALIASLVFEPVQWVCIAIIANAPGGLIAVGVYYIAMQLETLLLFVPQIVANVAMPMLSTAFGAHDRRRVTNTLAMSVGTTSLIAIGFVGFMLLFGPWVLVIFDLDPALHWQVFAFAVANAAVMAFAAPLGVVPSTSGYTWSGLAITFGWATTFITGVWLLSGNGAEGAVTARLIAWSAQTAVYVAFTLWLLKRQDAAAAQPAE
ncbi:MAG: oligosaccharide flippase family protein [Rhizobiaceae bacterium]|nr:oligosaccharide flippase family protein [Rhizobiaceae bacterium]